MAQFGDRLDVFEVAKRQAGERGVLHESPA
jgi:hypothetical protein